MWQRNKGQDEIEKLQNRFTAYLVTAMRRQRMAYINQINKLIQMEYPKENVDWNHQLSMNGAIFDKLPLFMHLENESLFFALKALNKKERYVFLERVLNEVSFEELAMELGLSYKGVAAIYYRTIRKIQNYMREVDK